MTPLEELESFLLERFEDAELRRSIDHFDPKLPPVLPADKAPPVEYVHALVTLLEKRGLLDHPFFDLLVAVRPNYAARIGRLRVRCMSDGELKAGARWRGEDFELLEEIGKGGFAEIWSATRTDTGRTVALKILHKDHLNDKVRRKRFLRGAETLAEHPHPHLVRVLSASEQEGGRIYFVMEYIKGSTLEALVNEGAPQERLIGHVLQVASALEHLHAHNCLHRDVKPSNVMVDEKGVAKLIDLDLVDTDTAHSDLTEAELGGTRRFAPPEAFVKDPDGKPPAFVPSFDVYSLAQLVVFVLSGGKLPLEGQTSELQLECSDAVRDVLAVALYKDRAARTPTIQLFTRDLRQALGMPLEPSSERSSAKIVVPPQRLPWRVRWRRVLELLRKHALRLLGAAVGLALIVFSLYTLLRPHTLLETKTFNASSTYAPIDGCTRLEIKAWGGGGGSTTHKGGGGGYVGATFDLENRNAFDIDVGTGGGSWRVGGAGRPGGAEAGAGYFAGARAGGYSAVRQGARILLIAGGGGGGGGAGPGGGGGGESGEAGYPRDRGGTGGTQVAGGLGGGHIGDGGDGEPGQRNLGGIGGRANPERGGGGGGGGGGHHGGGGGGADNLFITRLNDGVPDAGSGGGGGGSGWYDPQFALTGTILTQMTRGAYPANRDDPDYLAPAGEGGAGTGQNGRHEPLANGQSGLVVIKCWD